MKTTFTTEKFALILAHIKKQIIDNKDFPETRKILEKWNKKELAVTVVALTKLIKEQHGCQD